jgi:NAD(P)-dependent dehydrogenase (short-subunit alcohol dehydrogenase family)
MAFDFAGKIVLVTGGGNGIGAACARGFATATAFGGDQVPSAEHKAERARKIPLGRMVEPEDIADAALFLASDLARMCTGIALDVDGGVLIGNDIPYEEYFARAR